MGPPGRHGKQGIIGVPGIKGEKGEKGKAFINKNFKLKSFQYNHLQMFFNQYTVSIVYHTRN